MLGLSGLIHGGGQVLTSGLGIYGRIYGLGLTIEI
jgi:hypothetical protein